MTANAKDSTKSNCPWKLKIDNKIKISEDELEMYLTNCADIGPSLAKIIPDLSMLFERFFGKSQHYLAQ